MQLINATLVVTTLLLLSERAGPLHAYLDPGTGSIALQIVLGAAVAALATVKLYWDRLRHLVGRRDKPGTGSEEY